MAYDGSAAKGVFLVCLASAAIVGLAGAAGIGAAHLYRGLSGAGTAGLVTEAELARMQALETASFLAALYAAMLAGTCVFATKAGIGNLALGPPRQGARAYAAAVGLGAGAALTMILVLAVLSSKGLVAEVLPYQAMIQAPGGLALAAVVCTLGPVAEEMLIRGLLFTGLRSLGSGPAVPAIVAALVWALLHTGYAAATRTLLFGLGVVLAYLLVWSESLRVPIVAHASMNLTLSLALWSAPALG